MKTIIIISLLGDPMVPPSSKVSRAGGFNTDVKQWLYYLSDKNFPIIVFTNTSSFFDNKHEDIASKISLFRVPLKEDTLKNGYKLIDQYKSVKDNVIDILNKNKIDPVFFHSFYWYSGILACELSDIYGVPFVHTVIDMYAYKKITGAKTTFDKQEQYEKEIFSKASQIFAITSAEKELLLSYYQAEAEKILVLGRSADAAFLQADHDKNGVASEIIHRTPNTLCTTTCIDLAYSEWWNDGAFLYFGRMVEMKGIPYIVKTWYHLYELYKEETPPLWIVGGIPESINQMRKLIEKEVPLEKLEHDHKIWWWGYLDSKSISTLLLKSSVVIMHSQHESGGLVVLEALASGTPVIATNVGFAHDLIKDWEGGFLIEYGDYYSLEKRMEHFISHPLLSRCLGISAQEIYFSFQKMWNPLKKQLEIYQLLFAKKALPPVCNYGFTNINNNFSKLLLNEELNLTEICPSEIKDVCNNYFTCAHSIYYQPELSKHSNIWIIETSTNKYVLKRLYSKLNIYKFWNSKASSGIHVKSRIQKMKLCADCKYVIQPLKYFEHINAFLMEFYNECIIDNTYEINSVVELLENFHNEISMQFSNYILKNEYINSNPYTIKQIYESILSQIDPSHKQFMNRYQAHIKCLNNKIYSKAKFKSEESICILYGKSVMGHVIKTKNNYYLLPSDSIFLGEKIIDIVLLLLEKWLSKNINNSKIIDKDIDICISKTNYTLDYFYLSTAVILLANIKIKYYFELVPNCEHEELLLNFFINKL